MKKFYYLIMLLLIWGLTGCTEESPLEPDTNLVVIKAFIYAGEPVNDIKITSTLSLGSEDANAPPVNDGEVTIIKDNVRYKLDPSPGDSGYYYYPGENILIQTGDLLKIEVSTSEKTATGETVVPRKPENIRLSKDTLNIPTNIDMFDLREMMSENSIIIRWDNDESSLYFITVDNMEEDPEEIEYSFSGGFGGGGNIPKKQFSFLSQPTSRDSMALNFMTFTQYGRHKVKIYKINQEYADLYYSRNQDSRDLNEPLTNISNGLGVFSAFNSDSMFFYIKKE